MTTNTLYVVTTDCDEEYLALIPDDVDEFDFCERLIRNEWGDNRVLGEVYPASGADEKRLNGNTPPPYLYG